MYKEGPQPTKPVHSWNSGAAMVPGYIMQQPARILIAIPGTSEIFEVDAIWKRQGEDDPGSFKFTFEGATEYRFSTNVLAWRLC